MPEQSYQEMTRKTIEFVNDITLDYVCKVSTTSEEDSLFLREIEGLLRCLRIEAFNWGFETAKRAYK